MSVNTAITSQECNSEFSLMQNVRAFCRVIDFSENNLAANDHFAIFTLPAGAQVLGGQIEVLTVDAGGGKVNIGVGGTGHELLDSQVVSAATATKFTAGGVQLTTAEDTIDLSAETAALTTAKVRVTMLVLVPSGITTQG